MIPLLQTRTGKGGNCFEACLCSIMEVVMPEGEGLPCFGDGALWFEKSQMFSMKHGHHLVYFAMKDEREVEVAPNGYAIACGPANSNHHIPPEDRLHACVTLDGVVVHDPHPRGVGLEAVVGFAVLIPFSVLGGRGEVRWTF